MADASHNMQRPEVASTPLPRLSATERDARNLILASTVRGWEGKVSDLSDMMSVFASIIDDALNHRSKVAEQENTYYLTEDQIRQVFFCTYHSQKLVDDFAAEFFSALTA